MTRARPACAAVAAGLVLTMLATAACTGGPSPDPSGRSATSPTATAVPGPGTTDGTTAGTRPAPDPGASSAAPDVATGSPSGTVPGAAEAPVVTSLGGSSTATPLVARAGWQVVGRAGDCVLSWRGAADPAAPVTGARAASAALLAGTVGADGGDPAAPRDVLLPLTSDDVALQGVNAVAQDWSVSTPLGAVQVRGAARVVSVPTFDGGASTQSVVLALDCAGPLDEAAWQRLLADVRVGLVAPVEDLGTWPS